jgi:hypothetical protein
MQKDSLSPSISDYFIFELEVEKLHKSFQKTWNKYNFKLG